ncbi:3',5'-cyclic AMP phosphodiesterase CpdA [Microcella putealis]|uniref:3',5'-cyclic AMP phosphodiesterase CpdA n=1 Tax=Microcella putealis TaxID=337005 RepID=A0A4Q7LTJ0_9MICO|nr:phosphodiesterase [Microcella putealis]RZS57577.1 3',5'-cyclic AMP phosphodiesterase CpdA [Microcella putealis]TQM24644.1 3',5'-cyclic AMP phosphodiesterase CpdA [Microcella putealis]
MTQLGQYPPPVRTIVHLSDTHLLGDGRALYGKVPVEERLQRALERIEASALSPDAFVFTGDLTDLGEPDAYRRLRATVEPVVARMNARLIWVMGNHDERAAYASLLCDAEPTDAPQDRVYDLGGLRVISLDSTVPGYHHGELEPAQLEWLASVLAEPAPLGSILALHHPPVPTPLEVMSVLELHDQPALERVIAGSDIRAILGGHLHYSTHGTFAGIPVHVASATCYTLDLGAPAERLLSGVDGAQSFDVISVYADRVVSSTVPLAAAPEVTGFAATYRPMIEGMPADVRLEQLSSKSSKLNLNEAAASDV